MSAVVIQMKPIEINLLREQRRSGGSAVWIVSLVIIAAIMVVVPSAFWVGAKLGIASLDKLMEQAKSNIQKLEAAQSATPVTAGVDYYVPLADQLARSKPHTSEMLDRLTELIPVEANVQSLTYSGKGHIQLTGTFASVEHIVTFLRNIERSDEFRLVALGNMTNSWPEEAEGLRVGQGDLAIQASENSQAEETGGAGLTRETSDTGLAVDNGDTQLAIRPGDKINPVIAMTRVTIDLEYEPSTAESE